MVYACPSNSAFVAKMPIKQSKKLSDEALAARDFVKKHGIVVHINPSDNSISLGVNEYPCKSCTINCSFPCEKWYTYKGYKFN